MIADILTQRGMAVFRAGSGLAINISHRLESIYKYTVYKSIHFVS